MSARLLMVEDDESFVNSIRLALRDHPVEIVWADTGWKGVDLYKKNQHGYASVLLDYLLPDINGREVAHHIRKLNPNQDIVFASGYSKRSDYLTDMLVSGAARTFLVKGSPIEQARETILESVRIYENKNRVVGHDDYSPALTERQAAQHGLVGRSRAIQDIINQVNKLRSRPIDARVTGESGTGKELIAKALVPDGLRPVEVSCPEFNGSENSFESDLFGHVKGAFTGAESDKPGYLLQAHKGVLYLDEVHTLSLTNQQKFLRVLQERKFRKKGDEKGHLIPVSFRLISAAKPEIHKMIREGTFLEDLYFRLGQVDIFIPPLRERPEDIEPLVRHLQDRCNRKIMAPEEQKQFRISTIREMEKHPWMGNVRELEGAVCSMMLAVRGDIINPIDFDEYLKRVASRTGEILRPAEQRPMPEVTDELIREQIIRALKASRTQTEAADRLGIHRSKLIRSLKRLGIDGNAYLLKL